MQAPNKNSGDKIAANRYVVDECVKALAQELSAPFSQKFRSFSLLLLWLDAVWLASLLQGFVVQRQRVAPLGNQILDTLFTGWVS